MKVEMFWIGEDLQSTRETINYWLEDNPNIEIKYILQSADGALDETTGIISIWYEEKEQKV